jgi:DNA-binding NarL/FixJ family response regulator
MKPAEQRMYHFQMLSRDEQRSAIQRLATSGMSDHTIAAATGLSVEMIRTILGERANA